MKGALIEMEKLIELIQKEKSKYTISKETGISASLIGDYEKGKKVPEFKNLIKLADYFNVSLDYIAGRSTPNSTTLSNNNIKSNKNIIIGTNAKLYEEINIKEISYLEMGILEEVKKLSKAEQIKLLEQLNKE